MPNKIQAILFVFTLSACGKICGDGIIDPENSLGDQELCDDANRTPGDGCSADCTKQEKGFDCQTPGELCIKLVEICDDGIDNDEDDNIDCDDLGCINDINCQGECGNGLLEINEECDDANLTTGDGCDELCAVETASASLFIAAQDVNGEQPDLATFSVFGEADVDTNADGDNDSRALIVISSDNPAVCAEITDASLGGFINALFNGLVEGETVATFVLTDNLNPISVANTTITGDGQALSVDSGFTVADNAGAIVDTTFGSNFDGTITITTADSIFISGSYTGALQTEFIGGSQDLNIGFTGNFTATHCPTASDTMQGLIDILFN